MENKKIIPAPKGCRKDSKRIGRGTGSGWGCTAGEGNKGAQQRSGYRRKLGFEGGQIPLLRRLPKFGFNNVRFNKGFEVISVGDLDKLGASAVDRDMLLKKGFLSAAANRIKILSDGEITKAVTVTVDAASKTAVAKIEKAGGKVIIVEHAKWVRAEKNAGKVKA